MIEITVGKMRECPRCSSGCPRPDITVADGGVKGVQLVLGRYDCLERALDPGPQKRRCSTLHFYIISFCPLFLLATRARKDSRSTTGRRRRCCSWPKDRRDGHIDGCKNGILPLGLLREAEYGN